jgi:hypothetical protein
LRDPTDYWHQSDWTVASYSDFEQRVRRHRPSELLPAIASAAVEFFEPETWLRNRVVLPWALAAAAKTSIVAGNEHRNSGVTRGDVLQICSVYNRLDSPLTRHRTETTDTVAAFLVRTGYEQFAAQQSRSEEVARPVALFEGLENLETEILSHRLLEDVLGCSIRDFIGAGLVIGIGALHHGGFFDPEWPWLWHGPDAINSGFPMEVVREVFRRHFVTNITEVKVQAERYRQPDWRLRQHEHNPLIARPFVTLLDGRYVAPQPHYAFERLSAAAVYYAAVEALSHDRADSFTSDLGVVFQDYIGRQLIR